MNHRASGPREATSEKVAFSEEEKKLCTSSPPFLCQQEEAGWASSYWGTTELKGAVPTWVLQEEGAVLVKCSFLTGRPGGRKGMLREESILKKAHVLASEHRTEGLLGAPCKHCCGSLP